MIIDRFKVVLSIIWKYTWLYVAVDVVVRVNNQPQLACKKCIQGLVAVIAHVVVTVMLRL